ncbi:MAG: hypothetical protein V7L26_14800 [Nostoc sp.]|uniref:hypothetical protein n=1 Tax=Nostoc sp. TaxID=1180 RepID=UPI002FF2F0F4
MSEWSAIVFGRTYEVDYRFLAIPKDFTLEDEEWTKKYILAVMYDPEKLKNAPCWSIFKNKKYCVIGLTYRISDLENEQPEFDIRYDNQGRYIYVFAGYVVNLSQKLNYLPYLLNNYNEFLKLTKKIYKNSYQDSSPRKVELEYNIKINEPKLIKVQEYISLWNFPVSIDIQTPLTYPDSEDNRQKIWIATSEYILLSQYSVTPQSKDIALCIGAETDKYILTKSPFTIATVRQIVSYQNKQHTDAQGYKSDYNRNPVNDANRKHESQPTTSKWSFQISGFNLKGIIGVIRILLIIQLPILWILKLFAFLLFNLEFPPTIDWTSAIIFIVAIISLTVI